MKLRTLAANAEPNMATVKAIGMKIFRMNPGGVGGVNRRQLFNVIKRLPEMEASYAWMVQHKLVNEHLLDQDRPGYKTPFVVELTDAGRLFVDRMNGQAPASKALALPPVAYEVDRDLYAKIAVLAEMREQKPEELLAAVLADATKTLDPFLWDAAKKNRPDLFY
jgi:hypothetical protein